MSVLSFPRPFIETSIHTSDANEKDLPIGSLIGTHSNQMKEREEYEMIGKLRENQNRSMKALHDEL